MADVFNKDNVKMLMRNKLVWFFGDSNMRALYKDMVWLLQKNTLITNDHLKHKLEPSYMNDRLERGSSHLTRGRDFSEERNYTDMVSNTEVSFMFLTKCLTESLRSKLLSIKTRDQAPDVIIINSCVWDICRWGYDGVEKFKKNFGELMRLFRSQLFGETLVIWTTTPPVAPYIKGGVIIKQLEFMQESCRYEIMEGNVFARQEVAASGFDVLDLHYYLLPQIKRRGHDGIHWSPEAVRYMTNLILTHISLSWNVALPGRFQGLLLERSIALTAETNKTDINANYTTTGELSRLDGIADKTQNNGGSNQRVVTKKKNYWRGRGGGGYPDQRGGCVRNNWRGTHRTYPYNH